MPLIVLEKSHLLYLKTLNYAQLYIFALLVKFSKKSNRSKEKGESRKIIKN